MHHTRTLIALSLAAALVAVAGCKPEAADPSPAAAAPAAEPAASSPSPAVIQLLLPLNTFRQWTSLKRLVVHSFEPVSEGGQTAMELFSAEVKQVMEGKNVVPHAFSHQIAFNVLPETENALDTGLTRSEWRIIREVRRIWKLPDLNISVMCLRVPVYIGMSQSVLVDLGKRVSPEEIREVLSDTPGVRLQDDPTVNLYDQLVCVRGGVVEEIWPIAARGAAL